MPLDLSACTRQMAQLLISEQGLSQSLQQQVFGDMRESIVPEVKVAHASAALLEKSQVVRYPLITLYCTKVDYRGRDRRTDSSSAVTVSLDLHVSSEKLESVSELLTSYLTAVLDVLQRSAGNIADGVFLPGIYTATYQPPREGGKRFLQSATVECLLYVTH